MDTTLRRKVRRNRSESVFEVGINVFLWFLRILLILVVVIGSLLTLSSGKYSLDTWIGLIISGAVQGGIYALIALGYTMVYGILRMINFAHGDVFMIGMFAGLFTAELLDQYDLLNAGPVWS